MASIVKSLRLLADPTRLRLLLLLQQEELSVAEIQEIMGMGQSRISAHLGQLKQAQLVSDFGSISAQVINPFLTRMVRFGLCLTARFTTTRNSVWNC